VSREVSFTVPLVPPSVNHYKKPRRNGRGYYITEEAKQFKEAVAAIAAGNALSAEAYEVSVGIYLGHGMRGDLDNFLKVTCDALVFARVIHSDAAVTYLSIRKGRDRENPRTEITVRAI
jgi:Holliday junction resolvase RusA-like endonuclease